jgi:serine protease 7
LKDVKIKMQLLLFAFLLKFIYAENTSCGSSLISSASGEEYFPWIAIINSVNENGKDKFICSSSIINQKFSLTASHCVESRRINEIYLMTNVHDLKHTENSTKIAIEEIFIHPQWKLFAQSFDADLALLKFREILLFNENVSPICLWHENVQEQKSGKLISFTDPEENEPGYERDALSNFPKMYKMPIRSECIKAQPRFATIASNRTFCAGGLYSGPCLEVGNSGSALAVEINEKFYIRGIVSASFIDFAGCDNYTFSLFTDIPKFKDWIILNLHS